MENWFWIKYFGTSAKLCFDDRNYYFFLCFNLIILFFGGNVIYCQDFSSDYKFSLCYLVTTSKCLLALQMAACTVKRRATTSFRVSWKSNAENFTNNIYWLKENQHSSITPLKYSFWSLVLMAINNFSKIFYFELVIYDSFRIHKTLNDFVVLCLIVQAPIRSAIRNWLRSFLARSIQITKRELIITRRILAPCSLFRDALIRMNLFGWVTRAGMIHIGQCWIIFQTIHITFWISPANVL